MISMAETVNMKLRRATRERLKEFGWKGETYDDILNRLMDHEKQREA